MTVWVALAYLLAAVLFIVGLIELSSPKTARRGNQIAAVGMVIALLALLAVGVPAAETEDDVTGDAVAEVA